MSDSVTWSSFILIKVSLEEIESDCIICDRSLELEDPGAGIGKRKLRAKPPPKSEIDRLDTVFSCPFCNHGNCVECRIFRDMKNLIGEASCWICQESFSTSITALSEPIDVYCEWIDECERVNGTEDDDDDG